MGMRLRWIGVAVCLVLHSGLAAWAEDSDARRAEIRRRIDEGTGALAKGDLRRALAQASAAFAEAEALAVEAPMLEESSDPAVGTLRRDALALGLAAAERLGDLEEMWWFTEAGRAPAWLEALALRDVLSGFVPPPEVRDALDAARREMQAAARALAEASEGLDREAIRLARGRYRKAQDALTQAASRHEQSARAAARAFRPRPATLDSVRRVLRPDEALVAYRIAPDGGTALLVLPDAARIVVLPSADEVAEHAGQLNQALEDRRPVEAAVARLRTLLLDPLGIPTAARRLIIVPDARLAGVPFCLLAPTLNVAYVPSASVLVLLRDAGAPRGEGVLALGGPPYAEGTGSVAFGRRMGSLPGARAEARAVGDVVLLGAEATEAGWRKALGQRPRWRSVHLACHARVDRERPMLSTLVLGASDGDDGLLTALEILRLRIAADLVVLSANESLGARWVEGEGPVGLVSAFFAAGASRVLGCLGDVDDEAAASLMTEFYRLWNPRDGTAGLPTADALRKAQGFLASQARWKHPSYWAGWAVYGLPD